MSAQVFKFEKYRKPLSWLYAFFVGLLILFSGSKWEDSYLIYATIIFAVGCILIGVASMGRLWCTLYISGYKNTVLIKVGPYSLCRNPLYFFSLLGATGVGFATETLTIGAIIATGIVLYYPFVIKNEESRLLSLHGEEFERYKKTTPAFFPKFSNLQEPEEYVVKPRLFKKMMFNVLWFVWLAGILEIIEALHETNILPILIKLY
ncbi:MAG: isoprenylcysteine carboxylmethyltransferase family protein [Dissulfurispiraceae bacterium]|jgi:protein-S-isoprenylcysteine O-methyltransferase Ste14|nr:isoprenylcysteine carboxylmethyltransferase family protein [Dissulfurispiraceae bacterium]